MFTLPPAQEIPHLVSVGAGTDDRVFLEAREMPCATSQIGAIISHPYPPLGGDLDNNIVRELAHALRCRGISVLRYNMRGVGESTGKSNWTAQTGAADLVALANWWKSKNRDSFSNQSSNNDHDDGISRQPPFEIILIGYSFGALVTLIAAARVVPASVILISLPSRWASLLTLKYAPELLIQVPLEIPKLLVHAAGDELSAISHASAFLNRLPYASVANSAVGVASNLGSPAAKKRPFDVALVKNGNHFWVGIEEQVIVPVCLWLAREFQTPEQEVTTNIGTQENSATVS